MKMSHSNKEFRITNDNLDVLNFNKHERSFRSSDTKSDIVLQMKIDSEQLYIPDK